MTKRFVLSVLAANRIGILSALTNAIGELGGDLQEISQTVTYGYFTVLLVADFPKTRDRQIILDHVCGVCKPFGADVCLKDPDEELFPREPADDQSRHFLRLTGEDTPGLIRKITARLAAEEIDIVDLHAMRDGECGPFVMVFELETPAGVDADQLLVDLQELGRSAGLSAVLQPESQMSENDVSHWSRITRQREEIAE